MKENKHSEDELQQEHKNGPIKESGVNIPLLNGNPKDEKSPEGGWGFVVWFAMGISMLLQYGELTTVSIIFNDYLIEICGSESSAFNLLISTSSYGKIFGGIGVFMLNVILKKLTPRQVCFLGAFLQFCGDLTLLLMKSPIWFFIAGAVLKGLSTSLITATAQIVFSGYFVKLRTTMMSLAVVFSCIGGIIFPPIAVHLMHTIGLRWCICTILALNLHIFAVACVMVERKPRIAANKLSKVKSMNDLPKKEEIQKTSSIDVKNFIIKGNISNVKEKTICKNAFSRIILRIVRAFDLRMIKNPIFLNIGFGLSFAMYSEVVFMPVLPMILMSMYSDDEKTATIMSIGSGVELFAKLLTAFVSFFVKINNRLMFYISVISLAVFRLVLIYSSTYMLVLASTIAIAVSRTLLQIAGFLIIVDYVGAKNFAAANSVHQLMWMFILVIGNSIVGAVKSNSDGYLYSIYTINIFNVLCICMWTIEYLLKKGYIFNPFRKEKNIMNK